MGITITPDYILDRIEDSIEDSIPCTVEGFRNTEQLAEFIAAEINATITQVTTRAVRGVIWNSEWTLLLVK